MIQDWRDMPDGKEKYGAYLASREWAVKKVAVRERSKGRCEWCKHDDATQCHHQSYLRLYAEPLEDLLDVCGPCHRFLSGKSKDDPRDVWREVEPKKPYQFVILMDYGMHAECPVCLGNGNAVHMRLETIRMSREPKSDILMIPFWCECGCNFRWQLTTRKGYTTFEMEITSLHDLSDD